MILGRPRHWLNAMVSKNLRERMSDKFTALIKKATNGTTIARESRVFQLKTHVTCRLIMNANEFAEVSDIIDNSQGLKC